MLVTTTSKTVCKSAACKIDNSRSTGASGGTTTYTVSSNGDDGYFFKNQASSSAATTYSILSTTGQTNSGGVLFDGDDFTFDHYLVFFRFQSISIAQGATVKSAYLKPYVSSGTERDFNINGFDDDNVSAPSAASDGNHSNFTSASVTDFTISSSGGQKTSPDIKSIVQEIVDRAGWVSGNSLMFGVWFSAGTMYANRYRSFRALEYSSGSEACQLIIET